MAQKARVINAKAKVSVVEFTVLAYGWDGDEFVEPVCSPSQRSRGGDDDVQMCLRSQNTLGHTRNRSPKLKQPREIVRKNTSGGLESKLCKIGMAESFWRVRVHGVSEAHVHGVL